ncbi:MAG: T9SS type A sorting domain-containing protein, partial [Saprospiraceae bacterium]|nr:T9SS type A sorting domain-containing protein [Saprospiraceae bacterium]
TWTATDECQNTATCSTTYTWSVSAPVTINCPVNATISACSTQVAVNTAFNAWLATASFSGGCNAGMENDVESPPSACGESVTVTFTVFSECGDPVSCQATFTVAAPTDATLNCPVNTTVAACQTQDLVNIQFNAWLATASASGGCNGNLINNNIGAPSACGGSTDVTFTYFSECPSQTLNCTRTFAVAAPPTVVLTCPINTTVASCQSQAAINAQFQAWLATASASGGCNGNLINNNIGAPPACGGSTTVTFTYNSNCSPFTTVCSATFTVETAPTAVLNCPANFTATACQTQSAVNAQFQAWLASATASGGCNGVLTNNNIGAPSICGGSTTVNFTYSNACPPLSLNCSATFTVTAPAPVVLTCPAPKTVGPCLTQAQVNTEYANWLASATPTGGCNGVLTNNSPGIPQICNANGSTTTVTFNFTSTCGTSFSSCSSTFTVLPYPDFSVPANGATTVACPANATQPTPPTVLDACGKTLSPTGPVVMNNPTPLTCEGSRTYTWTYTDCSGHSHPWSFVYTIERLDFTVPANGSATVACPDETDVVPTPPVVLSNCGEVLTPVLIHTDNKPFCEGVRRYTWRYTDCEGNTHDWVFAYHIVYQDFVMPPNESASVECPLAAMVPVPPTVYDNCGKEVVPVGPFLSYTYNQYGCEASRSYSFEYTDCSGFLHTWAFVYSFLYEGDFAVYADEYSEVSCIKHAVEPIPPTIYDGCGSEVSVWLSSMTEDIDPLGCMGTRSYTFTYRDCGGHTHDWKFTYHVKDDIAPMGNIPDVDEEVTCLEDVPWPEADFSAKMAQIIAEGDFYDNCKEPIASLVSWTEFSSCNDADGDGIFTFGRTYYFSVKDRCGNAYPELIPVNYFGLCQPIGHFNMVDWGTDGGEPAASTSGAASDLQVIQQLLVSGPIKIGGPDRSLTVNDANCVPNLLPGVGGPNVLRNCHQTNCTGCNEMGIGGLKNALAANAIALELNIRYGIRYDGMTKAAALASPLDCISLHPCITNCNALGVCQLRIFDAFGEEYAFPYTVGGLQDLVNLYLNGALDLSGGLGVIYGTALNQSLLVLNAYGNADMIAALCTDDLQAPWADALIGSGDTAQETEWEPSFKIQPNPASSEFHFQLARMEQPTDVVLTLYNSLGQAVQAHSFDQVQRLNERIHVDGLTAGLYILDVKLGSKHYNARLMVQR